MVLIKSEIKCFIWTVEEKLISIHFKKTSIVEEIGYTVAVT